MKPMIKPTAKVSFSAVLSHSVLSFSVGLLTASQHCAHLPCDSISCRIRRRKLSRTKHRRGYVHLSKVDGPRIAPPP